eukprot:comp20157_c0_seq1/m.24938 comp20157_c0_seq1/g.24938  ORF comp20157_c0_seq1/g.24938 comp20157_c0_seq1/m.24938 type:complete len:367 (-) comp20157_c0_seq1:660-1760(-)
MQAGRSVLFGCARTCGRIAQLRVRHTAASRQITARLLATMAQNMSTKTVLLTRRVDPEAEKLLSEHVNVVLFDSADTPIPRTELMKLAQGVDGIMCVLTEKIDGDVLDAAGPQLKVVSNMAVGYDNIDTEACRKRGVAVGNTPGVLTDATADLTLALLLSAARNLPQGIAAVKNGQWGSWSPSWLCGMDIRDSTVGIVGLGNIGVAVAQRLKAFGVGSFLYTGRSPKPEPATPLGAQFVSKEQLFKESDFVILTCALTPETHHLVDSKMLGLMKPTALLVNSARGGVVDQDALLHALDKGQIGGAALDVCTPEPLPPTHPLLSHEKCIVLPHIGSATVKTRRAMAMLAVRNVVAGVNRTPLVHRVV